MINTCLFGDCRDTMRDGRFRKGERRSIATEFKPGQHWRARKPHWDKAWLEAEYVANGRSAGEIAKSNGCGENNILYWLAKHAIPTRDMASIRKSKYWGSVGGDNPMHGKRGALNPRYVDGSSPEPQRLYAQAAGRQFVKSVYARDQYKCQRCGAGKTKPKSLHAHHIKPWAGNESLRFDINNGVTLCRPCHSWVHSNANTEKEFLE